jgi:hypothetical protein
VPKHRYFPSSLYGVTYITEVSIVTVFRISMDSDPNLMIRLQISVLSQRNMHFALSHAVKAQGGSRYTALFSLTSALDGVGD